jgi:AcrR family transcriptional regulator
VSRSPSRSVSSTGNITPPRRTPIQRRSQERLERVLKVAESIIVERGFANLNMRELAQLADVNIATIYTYYPNGQSLLRSLADRYIEILTAEYARFSPMINAMRTPAEKVDLLVSKSIEFYERHPAYPAIWRGMQSDMDLLALDLADTRRYAEVLAPVLSSINPKLKGNLRAFAMLLIVVLGAGIRFGEGQEIRERRHVLKHLREMFHRLLLF